MTVLVTGVTGTIGRRVVDELIGQGVTWKAASRAGQEPNGCAFDFTQPATWAAAFQGVDSMLVLRPPALGNVERDMVPALNAARTHGVRHMVLISVQGADRIPMLPHARLERWLWASGLQWTVVRPSFFDQNLSTTHAQDIRNRDSIIVPAGDGRTAFVDAIDVAAVAARALADPHRHDGRIWTTTGKEALTYHDCARILSSELGRPIRYRRPGLLRYLRHATRQLGMSPPMAAVTGVIYTTARLGLAGALTDDVTTVLGRPPITFAEFVHREAAAWTT